MAFSLMAYGANVIVYHSGPIWIGFSSQPMLLRRATPIDSPTLDRQQMGFPTSLNAVS